MPIFTCIAPVHEATWLTQHTEFAQAYPIHSRSQPFLGARGVEVPDTERQEQWVRQSAIVGIWRLSAMYAS